MMTLMAAQVVLEVLVSVAETLLIPMAPADALVEVWVTTTLTDPVDELEADLEKMIPMVALDALVVLVSATPPTPMVALAELVAV